jgi:hypothetical protein
VNDDDLAARVARTLGLPVDGVHRPRAEPAWAIRSRRPTPYASAHIAWNTDVLSPELHRLLYVSDPADVAWWAAQPHPAGRLAVAEYERAAPKLLSELSRDEWREVRAAAVMHVRCPKDALRRAVDDGCQAVVEIAHERLHGSTGSTSARCVECAKAMSSWWAHRTCSVACSIDQFRRRVRSGRWVDAIDADRRHRYGFRDHWPVPFAWDVAARPGSGGIPGAGPAKRRVLLSFVRDVSAAALVSRVQRLQQLRGRELTSFRVLLRLAVDLQGPDELDAVVDALAST